MALTPQENRREFLQKAFFVFASLPVAGAALSACTKKEADSPEAGKTAGGANEAQNKMPDGQKQVDENDPVASSLGYKHDAAKVDTAKWTKKAGPGGDKQLCENCQFYTSKTADWGECQIIRSGLVAKGGWCNSWQLKPGAST